MSTWLPIAVGVSVLILGGIAAAFGRRTEAENTRDLAELVADGTLHPIDAKMMVASAKAGHRYKPMFSPALNREEEEHGSVDP